MAVIRYTVCHAKQNEQKKKKTQPGYNYGCNISAHQQKISPKPAASPSQFREKGGKDGEGKPGAPSTEAGAQLIASMSPQFYSDNSDFFAAPDKETDSPLCAARRETAIFLPITQPDPTLLSAYHLQSTC